MPNFILRTVAAAALAGLAAGPAFAFHPHKCCGHHYRGTAYAGGGFVGGAAVFPGAVTFGAAPVAFAPAGFATTGFGAAPFAPMTFAPTAFAPMAFAPTAAAGSEAGVAEVIMILRRACQLIGAGAPGGGGAVGGVVNANEVAAAVTAALRNDLNLLRSNTDQILRELQKKPGPGTGKTPSTIPSPMLPMGMTPVPAGSDRYAGIDRDLDDLARSRADLERRLAADRPAAVATAGR